MPVSPRHASLLVVALASAALLNACGGDKKPASTQVVAKVNDDEVSVHQLNFALQRQPGLRQDQVQAAAPRVLEALVSQQLAVQKAKELKLDRQPAVAMALDNAQREVLARAYAESITAKLDKPSDEDIAKFYNDNPLLFKERKIYTVAEFAVNPTSPEQANSVREALKGANGAAGVNEQLKTLGVPFGVQTATRPAESVPLNLLPRLGAMQPGQVLVGDGPNGAVQVLVLNEARPGPVDLGTARPAVERFITADRARKAIEEQMTALRKAAKVTYEGQFAQGAASAPAASPAAVPADATTPVPPSAPEASAPSVDPMKGLSGLK